MKHYPEQGSVIELEQNKLRALVLSKNMFNATGLSIVCPIKEKANPDALHISVNVGGKENYALIEHMRSLDLSARYYRVIGCIAYEEIQEITDAAQSIFDYYPFG